MWWGYIKKPALSGWRAKSEEDREIAKTGIAPWRLALLFFVQQGKQMFSEIRVVLIASESL